MVDQLPADDNPAAYVIELVFVNDTATTRIYTLSLHDALPIWRLDVRVGRVAELLGLLDALLDLAHRSEEHTSELQSLAYLVCRLLLEKKKAQSNNPEFDTT